MASLNRVEPAEMYASGASLTMVSAATGIPVPALRYRFLKAGILRTPEEARKLASAERRYGSGTRGKARPLSTYTRELISKRRSEWGERNAVGHSVKPSGYVEYTRGPHKGRSVHVVTMERALGRRLRDDECVHHRNGVKADNRIENLELMTRAEHAAHHARESQPRRERNSKGQYK